MAIIATGSKTIIDLSDGKSLSAYLGSNQPRTQIHDVNADTYQPNWTTTAGRLVITPVVYANQTAIALNDKALSVTWKRKEGSGVEANLTTAETVSGNVLTVNQNQLAGVTSGLLTYIAYVTYTDPDTGLPINATADITFALVSTGENAKSAWISGEQVFKYDKDGNVTPQQITLTANLQNVTMGRWQYKNSSGAWADYPTTSDNAGISSSALVVRPTHAIFNGSAASIRVTTSDNGIGDTTSIYKVQDGATGGAGAAGKNASTVFLTNENITFAGNASGVVSAVTKTCSVVAYTGTTKVTPVLGTISGAPTGMTVTAGTASANEIPLTITIAANSNLGGAGQLEGTVHIPVTSPVSTTLQLRWSKVNTGASGAAAYVLTVYSPGGTVFTNGSANGSATITLNAQFFQGATDRTTNSSTCYLWQKYVSGSWTTFKAEAVGSSGSTCTVKASDVIGTATFRCRARASSSSTTYFYDTITLIDKTDNYQADIDSTAGDVFKNTVGSTFLICRLWQNGTEVDPLKTTLFSETPPSNPTDYFYYYKVDKRKPDTVLMGYSQDTGWMDVAQAIEEFKEEFPEVVELGHTHSYTWYRRDKNGNPLDGGKPFAKGKVIYVDGDDVDSKTVFVCEVE